MSPAVKLLLWLHLLAALAFLLSVIYDLTRRLARKLYAVFSEALDGCAREVR